jgi:hypothetical protein
VAYSASHRAGQLGEAAPQKNDYASIANDLFQGVGFAFAHRVRASQSNPPSKITEFSLNIH